MGNHCCVPKEQVTGFGDNRIESQSFQLKCQICLEQLNHDILKKHLDVEHFASVKQKQKDELIVHCLLCDFQSATLQGHHNHMKIRHKYLANIKNPHKKDISETQTHESIKKKIVQITAFDLNMKNRNRGIVNGNEYQVAHYQKQYGAVQFDQDKSKGDLVWRYIFTNHQNAVYYLIEHKSGAKSILSQSKIFFQKQ